VKPLEEQRRELGHRIPQIKSLSVDVDEHEYRAGEIKLLVAFYETTR